ncbi:MAG: hypothetical protein BVN33_14825 [Proteobacteria bacterium ST_bin13]|nr:MAG: hypothetical protein BVN33_14825 [Proteobacteria bacterium ST_bin13]
MSNVIDMPNAKPAHPINQILASAAGAKLQDVVVIGWRENGEIYFASSQDDGAEVNWLLDMAKAELLAAGRE